MPKLKVINFVNADSQAYSLLLSLPLELWQVIAEYFSEKEMKAILHFALTSKKSYAISLACMQKELIKKSFLTLPNTVKFDDVLAVKIQVLKNLDNEEAVDPVITTIDNLSLTSKKQDRIGDLLKKYGFIPRAKIEIVSIITIPLSLLFFCGSLVNIDYDPKFAVELMMIALALLAVSGLVCLPRFVGSCTDDHYRLIKAKNQNLIAKFGTFNMLGAVPKIKPTYPQINNGIEDVEAGESLGLL
jgi:hypothetical protein